MSEAATRAEQVASVFILISVSIGRIAVRVLGILHLHVCCA